MKKVIHMIFAITIILSAASCGTSGQPAPSPSTAMPSPTAQSATAAPPVTEYTKEFPYLPAYPGMVLLSKGTADQNGYKSVMYSVKNSQNGNIISTYEKMLNKDGWKTTTDKKPEEIIVEKGNHRSIIVSAQLNKDTVITIVSK